MVWAAIAFWLVVGAIVLFVALRGGPGGARATLHTEGRIGRRIRGTALVILFAAAIGVPIAVSIANASHKADTGPSGLHLNAAETRGRTLFATRCATCHTLRAANAVGKVGPNLDVLRPPKVLVLNAIALGRARGNGQMPALLYTGADATDVADFVAAVAGH